MRKPTTIGFIPKTVVKSTANKTDKDKTKE